MGIKDWPADARPREKLLQQGGRALTDAELLAIFLRTGLPGKSAVDLARELLGAFGGLAAICQADLAGFCAAPGLGHAKYALLQAVLEMARRVLAEELARGDALQSPAQVADYLRLLLRHKAHEVFGVVFLDAQNRVISWDELFRGTLTQTAVYPREVVKSALANNAAAVIFAHNHPSGVAEPSRADEMLTRQLKEALALVDVRVLDHFIVAGGGVLSFAERGLL